MKQHIDGKTLLKAMDMIRRGEEGHRIREATGLSPEQLAELKRRARAK